MEEDLGPGVVVELAADVREARVDARGNAGGARQGDEQLRVLVAVAGAPPKNLKRARDAKGDPLRERIIHPLIDALGDDAWIALSARQTPSESHDFGVIALHEWLGHRQLGHHPSAAVGERVRGDQRRRRLARHDHRVAVHVLARAAQVEAAQIRVA